ncbi:hypothetical protein GUITHDRAFT_118468 [Guillardia theta CCMP2712]|uniref:J domain-containing protein n=1 Tax=Guillardia theta (strain CCMP2712) TaxID=905079 RepID=L1IHG2_GUITC|nr:hypothetical protein GUITHDRAFT_118468 [Guillardia theta CCMP2712]EKX35344.1 hypothetical protein GUITHDRAFT_118468 [Guillardia theta CCMP2712]|eukprot:XP_005822324.1 hypothetical protein GUITHDRAFT_118468 [Guillardia theta CCMP2712]
MLRMQEKKRLVSSDPYKVLGVNRNADASEIRNAYDTLVNLYHPDVAGDDLAAAQKFSEISNAYEVIGDEKLRRSYDKAWLEARTARSTDATRYSERENRAQTLTILIAGFIAGAPVRSSCGICYN